MVRFLVPLYWILGLTAFGVVALYLVRDHPVRRRVSTLIFWPADARRISESVLWYRIRRWASLLIQLIFLFLLIAALARPVSALWGSALQPVVIVLDTSASMRASEGGFSRLRQAQDAAAELVHTLGSGREAAVLASAPIPEVLVGWSDSRRDLVGAILRAHPADGVGSPIGALRLARNLAAARSGQIWFFSDRVWDGNPVPKELLDGVKVFRVGGGVSNVGITHLSARRSGVPGEVRALLGVGWSAVGPASPRRVSLFREGKLVDTREVVPDADRHWSREYVFQSHAGLALKALLEPTDPPDALAHDDRASVEVPAISRLEAVLVSEPDRYLEAALAAMPALDFIRLPLDGIPRFGDPAKLWIFQGALPPEGFQAAALVLIDPPEGGFFGERLGKMDAPWVTDQNRDRGPARLADMAQDPIGEAANFHPVAGAEIFASSAGRPLVFGQWDRAPRWVVFAWRPSRTGLTTRAAFPLLLAGLVQDLRTDSPSIVRASTVSRVLTALDSQTSNTDGLPDNQVLPRRPLWWWLVGIAVAGSLCEWWTWNRRITE